MKVSWVLPPLLSSLLLVLIVGCGGGGGNDGPPNVQLSIAPLTVNLDAGQSQQFTATVTGSTNKSVTWNISGTNCTGSACGAIDANGLYTAPAMVSSDMAVKVSAISQANSSVTKSSTANLKAIAVTASPKTMTVEAGDVYTVTASVSHTTNTAVTWSLTGTGCTGAGCGTVNNAGLYTAPSLIPNTATVVVKATSAADTTKSDSCTMTLVPLAISIAPTTITMDGGQSQQFTATVTNHDNKLVTWSLSGLGSITTGGLYSVPLVIGSQSTATVTATSVADPTKVAHATVTLMPLSITIAPTSVSLGAGTTQQFVATVFHHANKGVTWSRSGLGTVDADGLFTAPAVISTQSTTTVTVASVVDPSKSATAVVTLLPVSVTVSPAAANVALNGTQQFTATVTGISNKLVNWSVSGTGCSGNDCGTISASGLYTAPASVPNPPTVTVKATSAADVTKSGTATVTITQNLNARLKGKYALYGQGFNASGKVFATVSSFTADGNGNITNGVQDFNSVSGTPALRQLYTGTYEVWGDGRGTWTTTMGGEDVSARFALNADGSEIQLVEFDATGSHAWGIAKRQTATDFSLSKIAGDYAFAVTGMGIYDDRNSALGRFHANGAGALTDGALDSKTAGEDATLNVPFTATVSMDSTYGATMGRGNMTIAAGSTTIHAGFYMVNSEEAFLLFTDTTNSNMPLLSGRIVRQSGGPFSKASWRGGCAYYMTGTAGNPKAPALLIGYMEPTGTGSLYVEYARNHGGYITEYGNGTANYDILANGLGEFTSSTYGYLAFVMTGPNRGFLMGITGLDEVHVGWFEAQSVPAGGFALTSFSGDYPLGTTEMATRDEVMLTGTTSWTGTGGLGGTLDASSTGGNLGDQALTGSYTVTGSAARSSNGRGVLQLTQPIASKYIFYPVSASKLFMLNVDPNNKTASALVIEK